MTLTVVDDDRCKALVARCAPMGHSGFTANDHGLRIVTETGRTAAALVFSDYRPHWGTIEFSAIWRGDSAVESELLSTHIVRLIGAYAYEQLRIYRVWARTSSKNARAIALLRHIGFTPEGTSASFYGVGRHAETFRMLKPEWEKKYAMLEAA